MIVEIFRNIVQANRNVLGCNIYIGVQFHGMVDIAFIYFGVDDSKEFGRNIKEFSKYLKRNI